MKQTILILGNPQSHPSSEAFLNKFIKIMSDLNKEVYVISGDKPPLYDNVIWKKPIVYKNNSLIKRLISFLRLQIQIISLLWDLRGKFDSAILLPTSYLLPISFLKIMRKRICLFVDGKPSKPLIILSKINFILTDVIIVESESVINEWGLNKHKTKIFNGSMYVDMIFSMKKPTLDRKIVGFIGRLSDEKGVLNFVESIPNLLNYDKNLKFLIAGEGELSLEIGKILKENNLNKSVTFIDWIPHVKLPNYLNELKVIVLPSLTEGVPNILLEAMACGTPVLANPVGGIPSIIEDEKTGFLMDDNNHESISNALIKVLNDEETIEIIFNNALKLIEENYRYNSSLERYRTLLNYLGN